MATTQTHEKYEKIKEDVTANSYRNVDMRLSTILDLVFDVDDSGKDSNIPLTVVADGAVVTGVVISEDAWADIQVSQVEERNPKFAEALRIIQNGAIEGRHKRHAEQKDSEDPRPLRTKLHFRTATVVTGGNDVILEGLRVDLKRVTAWSLGDVSAEH